MTPPNPGPGQKDTIYLDIDEEITGIIGKVQNSPKNIVALVLPKRASVLQSTVNMKLLKRAADQAEKKVVLITSEAGLLPLAGAAGIYAASNLNAKPYLPSPPAEDSEFDDEQTLTLEDQDIDPNTPVGDLMDNKANDDAIRIDNSLPAAAAGAGAAKKKSGKKLSVPDFDRFRKKFFIAGALILLLFVGFYWAFFIAPKATITLKTESKEVTAPIGFTADTSVSESKYDEQTLRADKRELSKTDTEKVAATGQKDKGTKATGTIRIYNCSKNDKLADTVRTVPSGTGVSAGGFTFILSSNVNVEPSSYSGDNCQKNKLSSPATVTAQNNGDKFNLSARNYAIAGFSTMEGEGSEMSGGTSSIVKVVSQIDIDAARQKIADKQKGAKDELKQEFSKDDLVPIAETFGVSAPVINATPAVDSEAGEVTVTSAATYTMLGVKKDDLKKLISEELKKRPETEKQNVLDHGIDTAAFATGEKPSATATAISMQTTVILGPDINQDNLKKDIAGKKRGEAESSLGKISGVTGAQVELKPFWVTKIPKKSGKVTIIIQQANGQAIKP